MKYIDVKAMADGILDKVAAVPNKTKSLLILYAGDDPASASYMKGKIKDCLRCGIPYKQIKCESEQALHYNICIGNLDDSIGGIIVQMPLPKGWDEDAAVNAVFAEKDVDGFRLDSKFKPCTPEGIIRIMQNKFGENLGGMDVLLIGKGKLVGKPLVSLLLDMGCTLTVCHSRTYSMKHKLLDRHDVVITAAGQGGLVDLMDVNAGLVIDATIVRGADGKLHGDCYDFDEEYYNSMEVAPVPGGVGLMTRAILMEHMLEVQK